jgi:hypothetical protein
MKWIFITPQTYLLCLFGERSAGSTRHLAWFHSRYWLFFTAFVGLNLLQSAFTKWCLMEDILTRLGVAKHSRNQTEVAERK